MIEKEQELSAGKKMIFVSDLHLWGTDDPLMPRFVHLIDTHTTLGDTLVLAGDIFDFFVRPRPFLISRFQMALDAIHRAARRGVTVHYIEGNHDFLLSGLFRPEIFLHASGVEIETQGKRFLVVHGDMIDTADKGYFMLRAFFRSVPMRLFTWGAPARVLDWVGSRSSQYSRGRNPRLPSDLPHEKLQRLRKVFRTFGKEQFLKGYDFVVAGHCHDLDEWPLEDSARKGMYMNVGFPRVHESCVLWTSDQPDSLRRLKF